MKRIFILFAITLTSLVCCMTLHAENKEAGKSLLSFLEQYEIQEGYTDEECNRQYQGYDSLQLH